MIFTKILVIYPLDLSTKIAIYRNSNLQFLKKIRHKPEELSAFSGISDQWEFRRSLILKELQDNEIDLSEIGLVISRGGLIKAVKSGVYEVNEAMLSDLKAGLNGQHSINLGGMLAHGLLEYLPNARACIADPVVVDEMEDVARMTGHPMFSRKSVFHALNQKNIARVYARSVHASYESMNLVIAHMGGGGCSVAAHRQGRVVDVNQAFDGAGPFAINRTGTLPAGDLVRLCFSGKYDEAAIIRMVTAEGGLMAHIGTGNIDEIIRKLDQNDEKVRFVMYAMAYQIAKEIAAMYVVLEGNVDAVLLSGEIFTIQYLTDSISRHVEKLGKLVVFGSVNDMDALANNGLMVLSGETPWLDY